jgi:hypothetical protein
MTNPSKRLYEILDFVLDGTCTDDQRAEFSQLLDDHPELIQELTCEVMVHGLLQWRCQEAIGVADVNRTGKETNSLGSVLIGSKAELVAPRKSSGSIKWMWALAACLATVATWLWSDWRASAPRQETLGRITHVSNVAWSAGSTALLTADTIGLGRLRTTAGEFCVEFRSGPTMRVQGPVSLMIESDMLVHLDSGQATARVPTELKGFTIKTPGIDVIDQGTEFGVAARCDGFTDVVVFDGKVDLQDRINTEHAPKRLLQGEAVKVDRQGTLGRLVEIRRDIDGRWWSGDQPLAAGNVIARVSDNIGGSSEVYACYQTTYRGLQDEALAYSDNSNHQWNGLTADGLPRFLRGADYIRTFNDYRYIPSFAMTIELSLPANLYVFSDNRIPPPAWLAEQFQDTGVDIGLDEGPWGNNVEPQYRKLDVNTTAVGAGQSIDNVFSVWWRRCADGKPITLGNAGQMGETEAGRAMYGVAATPLAFETPAPQSNASKN